MLWNRDRPEMPLVLLVLTYLGILTQISSVLLIASFHQGVN